MPFFGQVWVWSLAGFLVGAALCWAIVALPARRRVVELEDQLAQSRRRDALPAAEDSGYSMVPGFHAEPVEQRVAAGGDDIRRGLLTLSDEDDNGLRAMPAPSGEPSLTDIEPVEHARRVEPSSVEATQFIRPAADETERDWFADPPQSDQLVDEADAAEHTADLDAEHRDTEQADLDEAERADEPVPAGRHDRLVDDLDESTEAEYYAEDDHEQPAAVAERSTAEDAEDYDDEDRDDDRGTIFTQHTTPIPAELIRELDESADQHSLVDDLDDEPDFDRTGYLDPTEVARYGTRPAEEPAQHHEAAQHHEPTQYNGSTQYDEATQHGEPAQHDEAAQYESTQYNEPTQYSEPAQYGESTQYDEPEQYREPAQFNGSTQYSEATQYNEATYNEATQYERFDESADREDDERRDAPAIASVDQTQFVPAIHDDEPAPDHTDDADRSFEPAAENTRYQPADTVEPWRQDKGAEWLAEPARGSAEPESPWRSAEPAWTSEPESDLERRPAHAAAEVAIPEPARAVVTEQPGFQQPIEPTLAYGQAQQERGAGLLPKRVPAKPQTRFPFGVQTSSPAAPPAPVAAPALEPQVARTATATSDRERSLFEPILPADTSGASKPAPPPPNRLRGARTLQQSPPTGVDPFVPPGPFGPGSAMPLPGGRSPSSEYTVKASVTALRYCSPESPKFDRTVAEVWFRSVADAERVGFRPLG
ncbi:hypothetical protein [Actinokineospora inagensis]|uniref:sunset domain-containing protein n=1 Tax=Actinokineospora inagensis TaxID=103730 RepID=UPI0003FA35CA|nr:hypothetical protein [Actinokineospora inagensis]